MTQVPWIMHENFLLTAFNFLPKINVKNKSTTQRSMRKAHVEKNMADMMKGLCNTHL